MRQKRLLAAIAAALVLVLALPVATAVGKGSTPNPPRQQLLLATALPVTFTYQGRLTDGGSPANGVYDLQFILFDAETGGAQVGPIVLREDVAVASGFFAVVLDFGDVFTGNQHWIQIAVRSGAATSTHTVLSPRLAMTATPNALFARRVGSFTTGAGLTVTATDATAVAVEGVSSSGTGSPIAGRFKVTSPTGTALVAEGVATATINGDSTALELKNGALKVSGDARTAFQATGGTPVDIDVLCAGTATCALPIDHVLANDEPTAMLQVTQVLASTGDSVGAVGVFYLVAANKWHIVRLDGAAIANTTKFNVLVIRQ